MSFLLAQATSSISGQGFFTLLLLLLFVVIFTWSLIWVYEYAERLGKSGCLVVLIVLFFGWPISLLLWIVFR
jgi:RsiW-degrading membrane proteinase PrsW (M82 family)